MGSIVFADGTRAVATQHGRVLTLYVEGDGGYVINQEPADVDPPRFTITRAEIDPGQGGHAAAFEIGGLRATVTVSLNGETLDLPVTEAVPGEDAVLEPDPGLGCHDWSAVHDFMPPGPARLRVHGICEMPTPGYDVTLIRAEPQGINPAVLLLNKIVVPPEGIVIEVITPTSVRYEEETDSRYTTVHILPDGVTIEVQDVH